jgi:DNA repair exonuclease SbcCD ATPase subunit
MFSCSVCGRNSKNRSIIDNCKHTRLKKLVQDGSAEIDEKLLNDEIVTDEPITEEKTITESILEDIPGKCIKNAYHCSDIHIRLNSRHEEYREVFDRFYSMLSVNPNGIIVCCGDILHSKNELSPDCIVLVLDFLESLAKIMPTFIIAGNHDAVLTNMDKMDSLSGILNRREIPGLYYLKNSGIYRYNNIVFGVSSLLDGTHIYADSIHRRSGDVLVGLYHGSVGSPLNDLGFKISGEKPLSEFIGYDLVMLGDIHKYQYLNNEKTVAYSSSLISQNFGECDNYHGFLEWDLLTKESMYRIVPNEYRHIRLFFDKQLELSIPSKCSLQVNISKNQEKNDNEYFGCLMEFKNMIKTKYPFVRTSYVYLDNDTNKSLSNTTENLCENMLTYISSRYPSILSDDTKWIMENIDWQSSQSSTNVHWTLLYMEWDNMCKYGPNNKMDFRKLTLNGMNGLIAPNSAGKSTFIDIITFLLFSRMNRVIANRKHVQPDIINMNSKKCRGSIYFSTSPNDIYMVEKLVSRTNDKDIKMVSHFYKLIENSGGDYTWDGRYFIRECLTGKDRLETDKKVSEIIGTYDDFVFHSLFLQFDNPSFRKMSPKDRKDFMYRLFSLDFLTKQHMGVKENLKKIKNTVEILNKSRNNMNYIVLDERRSEIEKELEILCNQDQQIRNELEELINRKDDLNKRLVPVSSNRIISELDNNVNLNRMLLINNCLDDVREFNFVNKQSEIMEENAIFMKQTQIEKDDINTKIIEYISKKDKLEEIGDFDYGRLNVLRGEHFPENISDKIAELRFRFDKCKPLEKPERTQEECIQLISVLDTAISKINLVKKSIEIDENVPIRYQEYQMNILSNEQIYHSIHLLQQAIKDTEENYEFNQECVICMKNPMIVQLTNMRKEIVDKEASLKQIDNSVVEDYARYKVLKSSNDIEEQRLEKARASLKQLRHQRDELELELSVIIRYDEYVKMENYRRQYDELLIKHQEYQEYHNLLKMETIFLANDQKKKQNDILDRKISKCREDLDRVSRLRCSNYDNLVLELEDYKKYEINRNQLKTDQLLVLNEIELYKKMVHNSEIEIELSSVKELIVKKGVVTNELNIKRNQFQHELGEIVGKISVYEKNILDLAFYNVELRRLEYLESILSVDGFSLYLLETNLANISSGVSEILIPMIGVSLKLCIEDNDLVMYSYRVGAGDKNEVRLDTFGGMEQFMLDLSFRILSLRYTMLPRSNLFILDETFSCFDNANLGQVTGLYDLLYSLFDHIIMITHLDKLKETISNMITISNTNGNARINVS